MATLSKFVGSLRQLLVVYSGCSFKNRLCYLCSLFSLLAFVSLLCSGNIFGNDISYVPCSLGGGVHKISDCCSNSWDIFLCMVCFTKALAGKQYTRACILHSGLASVFLFFLICKIHSNDFILNFCIIAVFLYCFWKLLCTIFYGIYNIQSIILQPCYLQHLS